MAHLDLNQPMVLERPIFSEKACRAAAQLGRIASRALSDGALSAAGYRLLGYLSSGDVAAKVLASKLAVSRPTVTAVLDWLEPRGFVTRRPDPFDKRSVTIAITPAGKDALASADALVGNRFATVLESLDDHEFQGVMAALEHVHDALNAYRERSQFPEVSSRD